MDNQIYICERCGKQHDGTYGSGRFCSKHCSCSRSFSKESKERMSKTNKMNAYKRYGYKQCMCGCEFTSSSLLSEHQKNCNIFIDYKNKHNKNSESFAGNCKYCGKFCKNGNSLHSHEIRCKENPNRLSYITKTDNFKEYRETHGSWIKGLSKYTDERVRKMGDNLREGYSSKRLKPSFEGKHHTEETKLKMKKTNGGIRRSTIPYKRGYYNGFYCDSSWELAYVIYNIEHNIEFERCDDFFLYEYENETHKYYPDFKEGDTYVEIKNFNSDKFIAKLKQFPYKIKVLYKDDMKLYLDYVIGKYGKDFTKMYETNGG